MFLRIFVLFVVVVVVVLLSIAKRILSVFEGKCYKIMMFVFFFLVFAKFIQCFVSIFVCFSLINGF